MKKKFVEYESPVACEYQIFTEGVLCSSLEGDNESYGPDTGDDDTLF
jgi:hypothetical protein